MANNTLELTRNHRVAFRCLCSSLTVGALWPAAQLGQIHRRSLGPKPAKFDK